MTPSSSPPPGTTRPPSTWLRVVAFVGALVLVLGLALLVGRATGPVETDADTGSAVTETDGSDGSDEPDEGSEGHPDHREHDDVQVDRISGKPGTDPAPGVLGLATTQDGYRLRLDDTRVEAGRTRISFRVLGPDGTAVTDYERRHARDLHLVVVRRDTTGFQHVHPRLAPDGTWSVRVDLRPGAWRVLADTVPAGADPVVLGADLLVAGRFSPAGLGVDRRTARVDGYDVRLGGAAVAGRPTVLTTTVRRAGRPVTDLQPYLGAGGHLVVLRHGDLGYLHVHPQDEPATSGATVSFETTFPGPGRYRLFLDFRHQGVVRTAPFTVTVDPAGEPAEEPTGESTPEEAEHDH